MKCKKCGAEFTEGVFCPECGEKYVEAIATKKKCKKCGAEFEKGNFCPECGEPYDEQPQKVVTQKKKAKNTKNTLPSENVKKKSKLPLIIGAVVVVLLALVLLVMGSDSSDSGASSGTDLSEYLPKGKDDVMKLISKAGLNEETPGFYTSEDLRITLDDSGLIDTMTLKTPKYNLYGIKVGDEYQYDHFFDVLSEHSYVSMGEDESMATWGITSGDQDRLIGFQLYSGKIETIMFMRHGAYEQLEMNQMAYEMEVPETETVPEETQLIQTVEETTAVVYETEKQIDPTDDAARELYGYYEQEFGKCYAYAVIDYDAAEEAAFLVMKKEYYDEVTPEETFMTQLETDNNIDWYGTWEDCHVYVSEPNAVTIENAQGSTTLYKQMETGEYESVSHGSDTGSSITDANPHIINPDNMDDPGSYLCSWSDSEYMTEDQLQNLDYYGAWIAKNEIYARHGRKFSNPDLQSHFDQKSWYYGTIEPDDFSESVFNEYEKANIQTIQAYMDKNQVQ